MALVLLSKCAVSGPLMLNSKYPLINTAYHQKWLINIYLFINISTLLLCTTNIMLHGIEVPQQISQGNILKRLLSSIEAPEMVDVIVTNRPFGGSEEKVSLLIKDVD
jgi:type I restriction-modification system DNA methylase subunit